MSPSTPTPTIFITSATGSQGLNLARLLRSQSYPVHATTRDPTSAPSLLLLSLGVHLTTATWDDIPALTAAIAPCTHLFLNTVTSLSSIPHEHVQTSRILSIALSLGISHVIFSSALTIDRLEDVTVFDPNSLVCQTLLSKRATETTLKTLGFKHWTILRGASFMENYLAPKVGMYGPSFARDRLWTMALKPTDLLPIVDTRDIAKFAVAAFQNPERFHGKEVAIAGEVLSIEEIAAQLSEAIGDDGRGPIRYVAYTEEEIEEGKKTNPMVVAHFLIKELVRFVTVEESKSWGVELGTFTEFLEREGEAVRATYCGGAE